MMENGKLSHVHRQANVLFVNEGDSVWIYTNVCGLFRNKRKNCLDEQSQAQGLGRVKRKFRASLAVALEATGSARDPLRRLRRHRPPPIRTLRSSCMDDEMIVEEEGEHYGSSV